MTPFGKATGAKLEEARKRLEETRSSLEKSRTVVARADAERDELARRQHAGELDEKRAAEAFREVDERVRVQLADVPRLERIAALLRSEIGELERAERAAASRAAVERAKEARQAAVAASAVFGKQLRALVGSAVRLERAREAADQFAEGVDELVLQDEPDWIDHAELEQVLGMVKAGPSQPVAKGKALAATEQRRRDREDAVQIRAAIDGLASLSGLADPRAELERILPPHLHARAWAKAQQVNAERIAQRDERDRREAAQKPQRVLR